MVSRIKLGELINSVQDISYELLQKDPRGHADFAAEGPGDDVGEIADVRVIHSAFHPTRIGRPASIKVSDLGAQGDKSYAVKSWHSYLDGRRVVESGVSAKVGS